MLITGHAIHKDAEQVQCWKAIAANATIGYAVDDEIVKIVNIDTTTGKPDVVTPYVWINVTQETVLTGAPVLTEVERCDAWFAAVMKKKNHTNTTTWEIIEIYEVVLFNADGTVASTSYITADGTAVAFTPTWVVDDEAVRVVVWQQVLAFDDSAAVALTVPAHTAGAHIQVKLADAKVSVQGTAPIVWEAWIGNMVLRGQDAILHSNLEVTNFKAIALNAWEAWELYIEYFNTSIETGI